MVVALPEPTVMIEFLCTAGFRIKSLLLCAIKKSSGRWELACFGVAAFNVPHHKMRSVNCFTQAQSRASDHFTEHPRGATGGGLPQKPRRR
jgi:hypothetical protein